MSSNEETNKMEPRDNQNYWPTQDGEKGIAVDVALPGSDTDYPKKRPNQKKAIASGITTNRKSFSRLK